MYVHAWGRVCVCVAGLCGSRTDDAMMKMNAIHHKDGTLSLKHTNTHTHTKTVCLFNLVNNPQKTAAGLKEEDGWRNSLYSPEMPSRKFSGELWWHRGTFIAKRERNISRLTVGTEGDGVDVVNTCKLRAEEAGSASDCLQVTWMKKKSQNISFP